MNYEQRGSKKMRIISSKIPRYTSFLIGSARGLHAECLCDIKKFLTSTSKKELMNGGIEKIKVMYLCLTWLSPPQEVEIVDTVVLSTALTLHQSANNRADRQSITTNMKINAGGGLKGGEICQINY
jgi:hypothetical protein